MNALSEHRSFALTLPLAKQLAQEVAAVVKTWKDQFEQADLSKRDLSYLPQQTDRPFLREQRQVRA